MTITAESIARAHNPHQTDDPRIAYYCRTGEHDRCSMVCACPHHQEPHSTTWAGLSLSERTIAIVGET
jgi:hypothetical protein